MWTVRIRAKARHPGCSESCHEQESPEEAQPAKKSPASAPHRLPEMSAGLARAELHFEVFDRQHGCWVHAIGHRQVVGEVVSQV